MQDNTHEHKIFYLYLKTIGKKLLKKDMLTAFDTFKNNTRKNLLGAEDVAQWIKYQQPGILQP